MTNNLTKGSIYTTTVEATVADEADVLVVGGGSAGVTAAIAAARAGADTLLTESTGTLGGMMTTGNAGLTNFIVHQKSQAVQREIVAELGTNPSAVQIAGGLPMEITRRLLDSGAAVGTEGTGGSYVFTSRDELKWLLLDMMEEAGVRLMLHSLAVDVILDDGSLRGVVFESKEGRQAVLAKNVIDATGDGDVAAKAGCPFVLGVGPDDLSAKEDAANIGTMSHMGVMYRMANVDLKQTFEYLKEHRDQYHVQALALYSFDDAYERFLKGEMVTFVAKGKEVGLQVYNSPLPGVVTLCCPCYAGNGLLAADLTRGEIEMRNIMRKQIEDIKLLPGFESSFLIDCPDVCVRETRHIQGEYVLGIEDVLAGRDFEDSIGRGAHTVDAHAIPDEIKRKEVPRNWCFHIPYRSLVPKGVENLLVAGRCASFTHEAFGCARTTVQCMVAGEAAGVAAAVCSAGDTSPRSLDPGVLRQKLAAQGVLL